MAAFETPGPVTATLELPFGDARVIAAERDSTVVEVRPSDPSSEDDARAAGLTRVELADDRLLVRAPKPRGRLGRDRGGSVDVTIELPAGSHLHGALGWGDLRCDGPLGDCRIKSGLGLVLLDEVAGLRVKSGAGDVRLGELGAGTVVRNANGNTSVGVVAGDLRVKAANGDIVVDSARATVVASPPTGTFASVARGAVTLETNAGEIEAGGDTVELRARTSLGDIVIRRAPHG